MAIHSANGYVLNVSPSRRDRLLDAQWREGAVSEPVPEFEHSRSHPLVCFVSFLDGTITHLAVGRRGVRAGTGLRRLHLEDLTRLSSPITYPALSELIPNRFKSHVAKKLESGGPLPPGSFVAVVDAVRSLLPDINPLLERFSAVRHEALERLGERVLHALAFQKETVSTALAFADIPRAALQGWQPQGINSKMESFLDGLPQARLREDQMLLNDLYQFPGLEVVRTMAHGAAVFSNGSVRLTVVMANRQPLERQTGADLIYRNETFDAFVVVQYKAMEQESGGSSFRLPNEQLKEELNRMDLLLEALGECEGNGAIGGFRLNQNPFFLKLCPRVIFDPDSTSLINGMYIPLDYWRRLESDPGIEGQRGGRAVTFDNVGRYFNNTTFAELVREGWVGTTGVQTQTLDSLIRTIVESGRTVTIALKQDIQADDGALTDVAAAPDEPLLDPHDLLKGP
jgi:hypothetical protein